MFKKIIVITFILFSITKADIALSSCTVRPFPQNAYNTSGVCLEGSQGTYEEYRETVDHVDCPPGSALQAGYIRDTLHEVKVQSFDPVNWDNVIATCTYEVKDIFYHDRRTYSDCDDPGPPVYMDLYYRRVWVWFESKTKIQEVCDGEDNDCDGEIDEGCEVCTQEICDGEDNDCNGQIDETCDGCSLNSTDMGSSANLASGNLYHSQQVLGSHGTGLTANITIAYNSLDTTIGPLGRGWIHNYSTNITQGYEDTLVLMEEDGRRVYFYNNGDDTYSPDASSGSYSIITKNPDGSYILTEKTGIEYNYNSNGKLTGITDRNSNTLSLTYTGDALTLITDSSGRETTLVNDSDHRVTSITDNAGRTTTFTYNSSGYLSTITGPSGNTRSYTYDAEGRMLTKTDPSGYTTTYTYDANGKVISSQDPEGNTKTLSYDQTNQIAYVTEKNSGQWTYIYDNSLDAPLEVTGPLGNKTTYQYDSNRNLISKTEPDGSTTTYAYDAYGNVTSQTDSLGNTTAYTYNSFGQVTSITDPLSNTTTYTYDTRGNLITITEPTGSTTQMTYDARGNVTSITNPNGQTTIYTYDQYNNLISITDPTGATTSFTYDASGNMLTQTNAQGNTTRFEYNSLNQLIKIIDPSGNITIYTYDSNGNKIFETDANGSTTYYEYNYKGQLTKVTDTLGNVTTYTYEGAGCPSCGSGGHNLTSITDANGNTTTYQYNILGRLIGEADPLGNTITYSYDSKGNLIQKTNANGNAITYTYDSLNRLISKNYPDGTQETFTYNAGGNITTASNQYISYTFSYDANGRMTNVTGSNGRTISYQYDSLGNKTRMTTLLNETVSYTYDVNNRLTGLISSAGTFNFAYDSLGRRMGLTYPNGATATYSHDSASRLTSLIHKGSSGSTIGGNVYTHDNVGNRLTKATPERTFTYQYDNIYRLTEAISSTPGYSTEPTGTDDGTSTAVEEQKDFYTYDPVGNRLTSQPNRSYTYNAGNQLLSSKGKIYTYDRNGNLISKSEEDYDKDGEMESWTYFYDYDNRLIKVVKQEEDEIKTVTFKYDPFGRRIEKKVTEDGIITTTRYFYDNEDVLFEYDENGNIGNRYIHGLGIDEPLALVNSKGTYYYHADGLGSIMALTDSSGEVVQTYEYDSFGNLKDQENRIKQPYTYTGREWDKETGLYYYRARYYDAEMGRFISEDPIGFLGGDVNLYAYVWNNPINSKDPFGLQNKETGEKYGDMCAETIRRRWRGADPCKISDSMIYSDCLECCLELVTRNPLGCVISDSSLVVVTCVDVSEGALKRKRDEVCKKTKKSPQ